ncbi:hypothetical protein SDC9_40373 [bioreactor metagenome]|uniref:Secretion system C-terminal sorting domain-containing protein n=2 Tax=root TaxID=1 RepID=A0A644VV37_9ZZZZ
MIVSLETFSQQNDNFYTIKAFYDAYYEPILLQNGIDNMQGTGYNPYQNWVDYYEPILYPSGDFVAERQKLNLYINNFILKNPTYSTSDLDLNWDFIGPDKMPEGTNYSSKGLGQIHYIAFDPNDISHNKMFACSPVGGLWKSSDGGNFWTNCGTDKGLPLCGVSSVAIDPENSETTWFVTTGNGEGMANGNTWGQNAVGVWRTTNAGLTWESVGLENIRVMRKLVIRRHNNQIHIFVATGNGLYECEDALSANPQFNKLLEGDFYDVELDPVSTGIVYASGTGLFTSIYKIDWINDIIIELPNISSIPNEIGRRLSIEISASSPNFLFIIATYFGGLNSSYLYRYDHSSNILFSKGQLPNCSYGPQGVGPTRAMGWAISPVLDMNGNLSMVYGNTAPIRYTDDLLDMSNTCSWVDVTSSNLNSPYGSCKIHVDMHHMIFEPGGQSLWVGNDGGVFKSTMPDLRNNWLEKSNGLGVATVHHLAISEDNNAVALSGAFDCGSNLYNKLNGEWNSKHVKGGDGFQCNIDWNNPLRMWVSSQNGSISRSINGGIDWSSIGSCGSHWHTFFIQSQTTANTLYSPGPNGIRRSTDAGTNWQSYSNYPNVTDQSSWRITNSSNCGNYLYTSWIGNTSGSFQKVFKSVTGGGTNSTDWEDIGSPLLDMWINSIAIDYFNPDHIWVAVGYKVYDVNTITHLWTDMSNGFPSYISRVGHLEMYKGVEGLLFAATNYGLYEYDFDNAIWEYVESNLPNVDISDMQMDYVNRRIVVGTFGRGIWEANLPCGMNETALISGNIIWDKDHEVFGDIKVQNGSQLTIQNSTIKLPEGKKIVIERGGKIIINGGKITNSCGNIWSGIEVHGNSNVAQAPSTNQGVLIINGGTIENAECGIRTWKPLNGTTTPDPNYYGGLIMATDANFVNNIVAVEILPYSFANYGFFKKCNFITNAALPNGKYPDYFVKLNGISNISFKGCLFENTYQNESVGLWGSGIYAYDADVLVDETCISNTVPCGAYLKSKFTGLYRGIYALGSSRQRTTAVHNSEFINNLRGMYLGNIDFANIKKNDFEILGEVAGLNPGGYGLYVDASTAFAIEENDFYYSSTSRKGIGLVINEAGPDNNEVYNNTFQNLEYGTIAQGYNRQSGGSIDGLCYKCNDFINNGTDIRISPRNSFQVTAMDGIAYHQGANIPGNNLAPAGNTFTTTSNLKDISNVCNWIIYYRHHYGPASLLPNPADLTTNYQVFGTTYTKTGSCPSRIGTGTGKEEIKLAMEGSEALAEEAQAGLDAIVDGGSTTELHQVVISSTPDEGLALRNQLVTDSPYLSDTILKTSIIKEEVLNNAMLRDVLVSNPQAAKSAQMVEMLDSRMVPMTDEMKNEVLAGQLITSAKENLEATISSYKHDVWVKFSTLCNLYANDTLHTWQSDTIGLLLAGANTPGTRYQLAFWQLFKGNPSAAQQVINNIPSEFTLDASEQSLHTRYFTLLNELIEFENNPALVIEPGTVIYEALMQLSTSAEDKPAALSRNILLSDNLIIYEEPVKLDDGLKSMPIYKPELKAVQSQKLRVFPNPANTFITVSWNVPGQETNILMIHDANGRQVLTRPLQGQHNEAIIDISGFVNGNYAVILSQGGKTIAAETLVIAR